MQISRNRLSGYPNGGIRRGVAPLRILQLIGGDGRGGADQVALSLGEGLRRRGIEVHYAVRASFLQHQGRRLEGLPVHPLPSFRPWSASALAGLRKAAQGVDLILTHDSWARHLALAGKAAGLRPALWFMRHCIVRPLPLPVAPWQRLWVARQIAASDAIAESLATAGYPPDRIVRIHAGRNLAPFAHPDPNQVEPLRKTLGLDGETPRPFVIGMVARFDLWPGWRPDAEHPKGFDVLFAALARLHFPYRVIILGPPAPADHQALREMARHHGAKPEWLVFGGFQPDISAYYPLMDVNVLPSRREGLGLALVEGLAAGVPVLGSGSGGIVEVIRHGVNGYLFPEGDGTALANHLTRLAKDARLRRRLGNAGQDYVLAADFAADRLTESFLHMLSQQFA